MKNMNQLQEIVQKNCDLIDAEHGQNYGLCIYLLKMRDYYRWRNRIPLHQEIHNNDIHQWIAETEEYWEKISGGPFMDITVDGRLFSPFDSQLINECLIPNSLIYSGGLGYGGIPMFFLAELEKKDKLQGFTILTAGKELSRGLFGSPALYRDNVIYLRREALKHWLWSKYDEWGFNKLDNTMGKALSFYPFETDPVSAIDDITNVEVATLLQHEIGEGLLDREFGEKWQEMVIAFAYTKTEILLRAVRDLAVDCMTTLPYLVSKQGISSIHLYFAGFSDMRKELYPSLYDGYKIWQTSQDFGRLSDLIEQGKVYWYDIGKQAIDIFTTKGKLGQKELNDFIENLNY